MGQVFQSGTRPHIRQSSAVADFGVHHLQHVQVRNAETWRHAEEKELASGEHSLDNARSFIDAGIGRIWAGATLGVGERISAVHV